MSKIRVFNQCLVATLLLSPAWGYCESYLFPTDIVPQGKFDVEAGVSQIDYKQKSEMNILFPLKFETHHEDTQEFVRVRYGLATNTHIGIVAPYNQRKLTWKTLPGSTFQLANITAHEYSAGNLNLFAKHRFYTEGETPFSLSAAANLEANTANNNYTALDLILSTGWTFNEGLRAYATASTFLSDQDAIADRQMLDIGFYKQITPHITLVPYYAYSHVQQAKMGNFVIASTHDNQFLGVSAQIEVLPNTYLIPSVSYFNAGGYHNSFDDKTNDSFDERSYSLTLYHLF